MRSEIAAPDMSEALPVAEQPELVEIYDDADGIYIRQIQLKKQGYGVPGHKHTYDHTSMLATGAVRAWRDDKFIGDFVAPTGIKILAGCFHKFVALEDNTVMYCIHNTHGLPKEALEDELVIEKNTGN